MTRPKQKNRHHKIQCNQCGIALRATTKQLALAGPVMRCINPACDGEMIREEK